MKNVKNRKVIGRLAWKSFLSSKKRNIIAILAIMLTSVLFTALFGIGFGLAESMERANLMMAGGEGHAVLKYISDDVWDQVKNHPLIQKTGYEMHIADSVDNEEFLKRPVELNYYDETLLQMNYMEPSIGRTPQKANEILADTVTLDTLGIPHEIGQTVPLSYTIKGVEYRTDFVLSGIYPSNTLISSGVLGVSKAFVQQNRDILAYTYREDLNSSGSLQCFLMFSNTRNLWEKLEKVIADSGFTVQDDDSDTAPRESDIDCNVNWAYLGATTESDPVTIVGGTFLLLLVILSGYLIIYNIFQISVQKDIRFYGLLKTIGATGKQLKRIIHMQALILCIIGIPAGLVIGYGISALLLPVIMKYGSSFGSATALSINPLLFLGAAAFTLLTTWISTSRPGRMAAAVSCVEAVRYTGVNNIRKKERKSTEGAKIYRMAFSNLFRNRKRTAVSVISLSLSLILLNTVFTMVSGFRMDTYISMFVDTDFLIGHANYFNVANGYKSEESVLSESFIREVEDREEFLEGGRIYAQPHNSQPFSIQFGEPGRKDPQEMINHAENGYPAMDLYGLEDLQLSRLEVIEGSIDPEKLKTGKYILEAIIPDDYDNPTERTSHYTVGDKVTIYKDNQPHTYEVLGKVKLKHINMRRLYFTDFFMLLPASEYLKIADPCVMSYGFNVKEGSEAGMEAFVKDYTENREVLMNYESKEVYAEEYNTFCGMLILVGGILSAMVGVIGVLNFINSILTGILSRRQELASMQAIGMTKKQLMAMLMLEGVYYAGFTIVFSLIVSCVSSLLLVRPALSALWFFSYRFEILPLFLTFPFILVLSVLIPYLAYLGSSRQSIVERLREME